MSLPVFPSAMFPNVVTILLSDDTINVQGGAKPNPAAPLTFAASVQPRKPRWDGSGSTGSSHAEYNVRFPANPNGTLRRALRAGDEVVWNGRVLSSLGGITDSGGYGWIWVLRCEYVTT